MTTRFARIKRVLTMDADEALDPLALRLVLLFRRYPWRMHALGLAVNVAIGAGVWLLAGPKLPVVALALLGVWILVVIVASSVSTRLGRNP